MSSISSSTETQRIENMFIAIAESEKQITEAKTLIRQIELAKDSASDTDMRKIYANRITDCLVKVHTVCEKVYPDSSKWGDRAIKVITTLKKYDELYKLVINLEKESEKTAIQTSDDKIFIISPEVRSKMGTLDELVKANLDGSKIVQLPLSSDIFSMILKYIENPKSVEITKENLVQLYSAALFLDLSQSKLVEENLLQMCIKKADEVLNLRHFTKEFCGQPGFIDFFRSLPDKMIQELIEEYLNNRLDQEVALNIKNIAPYIRTLKHEVSHRSPKSFSTVKELIDHFKLLGVKLPIKLCLVLSNSVISAESDIVYLRENSQIKLELHILYCPFSELNAELCKLPNLESLYFSILNESPREDRDNLPVDKLGQNIKKIYISDDKFSDDNLHTLSGRCSKLESATFINTTFTLVPFDFAELKTLKIISNKKISSLGFYPASTYPKLIEIDINGCENITKENFPSVFSKTLKKINAKNTRMTIEEKGDLKKELRLEEIE